MPGSAPIREPIIDPRTGRLTPVWERYFVLTLNENLPEGPDTPVDFSSIIFGDGDGKSQINTLEKLFFAMVQPQNFDLLSRLRSIEEMLYSNTSILPQELHTDADVTFDTLGIDCINFNLTPGVTPAEGEMCWNADEGTLNLGMPGGNVVLQLGQEILAPKAKAIGSNINNGDLVFVSGGSGSNPEMTLAKSDALSTSMGTIAMATEDILQNQFGYFTALGLVRLLDTSAYAVGDILYLSAATAGTFTNVEPTRPNFAIRIGVVIRVSATEGIVYVDINERGLIHLQQDNEKILFGAASDASMYYDGTDFCIKLDEVAASDLNLDCGTNKTLELQESVWDDIQFPVSTGTVPAANYPDYAAFTTNTNAFKFDVDDYIDLQANEMLHWWKEGTDVYFHVHTALDGANASGGSYYAKFTIYIAYADDDAVFTETSKDIEIEIPDGTADMTHLFGSATALAFTGLTIGTQVEVRVKRIAATTGTEYPNHIFITQVGLHAEKNTLGSRQIGTK